VDFAEICKVCARKTIIKAAKRIINSDKMCCSYSDLNFGVTFWNTLYVAYIISAAIGYRCHHVNYSIFSCNWFCVSRSSVKSQLVDSNHSHASWL